jgi:hypothetical protein
MFLHATKRHILDHTSYVHSQHKFIMVHGRATNWGSADKGMVRTLRSEQSDGTETLQSSGLPARPGLKAGYTARL